MNAETIWRALTELDDDLILDANQPISAKTPSRRRITAVLLAAALALLLIGCTYTVLSGADWFKAFFSGKMKQDLSAGQSAYIDSDTQKIAQSVTTEGYTVTIESAIADSLNAYFVLRIDGPPGTTLGEDLYFWPRWNADRTDLEDEFYNPEYPELIYGGGIMEAIDDGDPNDNSFKLLYTLAQSGTESMPPLEEGVLYKLHLTDLQYWDEEAKGSVMLTKNGVWDFDIVFESLNDDCIEFIHESVPTAYNEFAIEVTSFQLRAMSADATYTGREDEKGFLCFVDSAIVLKDGTRVPFGGPGRFGVGYIHFTLSSPIDLDEVDYIELRDGTRLTTPQE